MKKLIRLISYLGLALTIIPSFFVFNGGLSLEHYKLLMLAGTMTWIFTAPFWVNEESKESS